LIKLNSDLEKKKIINVVTTISDGGLDKLVYHIYEGLDKNIFTVDICLLTKTEETFIFKNIRDICANVYNLDFRNRDVKFGDYLHNLIPFFKLLSLLYRNKYDVVHSHDFFSAFVTRVAVFLGMFLYFRKPKRVYITLHVLNYFLKPVHHFINRQLSRITDKIVCVSKSVFNYSFEKEKIKKEKYIVIYNSVNCDEFFPDENIYKEKRKELGYSETDFIIGNVGVLSVRKGQIYLLKAFNGLKKKFKNIKLVIVGSTRAHEMDIYNELLDYIRANNLRDEIKILGTTEKINELYNIFDLFVMPSVTEGFGLSAFEAMLTEKIVLFSDIPVYRELIEEGKTGFIFKSKSVESLSEKLDYILTHYNELNSMKKYAREFVLNNFSMDKMTEQYNKLYNS